jgi:hypothetical protein
MTRAVVMPTSFFLAAYGLFSISSLARASSIVASKSPWRLFHCQRPHEEDTNMANLHQGECFCGAVHLEVSGEPEGMGYCHCRSCRSWSGGPVNAFTLWKPDAVRVTAGSENLATFQKTEISQRQYCAKCGGHLMTRHPTLGLVDVFAATLPTLEFKPGLHVNYAETVLPMRDGLPKLRDFPKEFGGSGETLPE